MTNVTSSAMDTDTLLQKLRDDVEGPIQREFPGCTLHLGADHMSSPEPHARSLRERGGHFNWLAVAVEPFAMWDYHVGVVARRNQLVVGLHLSRSKAVSVPPVLHETAQILGAVYAFEPTSLEHQWTLEPVDAKEECLETVASRLLSCCRSAYAAASRLVEAAEAGRHRG